MRKRWILVATVLASIGPALADDGFVVQKSDVLSFPADMRIARGTQINIPQGGRLTLADENGGQRICVGSYKGPVESCPGPAPCSAWESVLGKCDSEYGTGGVGAGGTRGPPQ